MPRTLHVYLDESGRRIEDGQVMMVGALLLPDPLGFQTGRWYTDLLRHPHATEIPKDMMDREGRKQARVLEAVATPAVPDMGFSVLAVQVARDGERPLSEHYESAYLGLVMELIARERLGGEDTLVLYPERFGGGGATALQGRFQAIAGALRWLSPRDDDAPNIDVEAFPKTPDVLVGQSIVDAMLWNLGRALFTSTPGSWQADLAAQWRRLGFGDRDHLHLSFAPDLHDARGLAQWAARRTGRLEAVDWEEVARRAPDIDHTRLHRAWAGHGDAASELDRALRELSGLAENAAVARKRGVSMDSLVTTLGGLTAATATLPEGPERGRLERRRQYLLSRAQAHRGQAEPALDAWAAWQKAVAGAPLTPALLEERLLGNNALAVLLTDFEAWGTVEARAAENLALIERHRPGFAKDPLLGRCLGALAQARVLAGARDPGILALLERSRAQFEGPVEWSYAWTWGLVALGRGAPCEAPEARADDILAQARAAHGDDLAAQVGAGRHPYLAWGLAEAMTAPGLARHLGSAWAEAIQGQGAAHRAAHDRGHPGIPTLRALAIHTRDAALFDGAWRASRSHAEDERDLALNLGTGHGLVRLALRTVPAWLRHARTAQARDAHATLAGAARRVLDEGGVALPGLATRLEAVADLDPTDAEGADAVLAMGGY